MPSAWPAWRRAFGPVRRDGFHAWRAMGSSDVGFPLVGVEDEPCKGGCERSAHAQGFPRNQSRPHVPRTSAEKASERRSVQGSDSAYAIAGSFDRLKRSKKIPQVKRSLDEIQGTALAHMSMGERRQAGTLPEIHEP